MRFIKWLFWIVVGLVLVITAFANTQRVTLTLLPPDLEPYTAYNYGVELPLYIIIFGGVIFGVAVGFLWEWLREYKYRSEKATYRREKALLESELKKLKAERNEGRDDVLALLESGRPAR